MRLSFNGELCTVRYKGPIPPWTVEAYGVEWDDPSRGKHDGVLDGVRYFDCRVPGAGSFVKVTKSHDDPLSIGQAIDDKYMASYQFDEIVLAGNKIAKPVGLDKFQARLNNLENLRIVSLAKYRVASFEHSRDPSDFKNMWRLDLSYNLFEDLSAVCEFLAPLAIESLDLAGNRLATVTGKPVASITDLNLGKTLVTLPQVFDILESFPNLQSLSLSHDQLDTAPEMPHLAHLDLSYNNIETIRGIQLPQSLILSNNNIVNIDYPVSCHTLDLSYQPSVLGWPSIDHIDCVELTISHEQEERAFIISRIARLQKLNGTDINPDERKDAELYTLSKVAEKKHPEISPVRWKQLIDLHGEPTVTQTNNSISSRLVELNIDNVPFKVLKTATIQRLAMMVGRKRGVLASTLSFKFNGNTIANNELISDYFIGGEDITTT